MPARLALLLASALAAASATAQTGAVTGLLNTGVDATGAPLGGYAADPHYAIVGNAVFSGGLLLTLRLRRRA